MRTIKNIQIKLFLKYVKSACKKHKIKFTLIEDKSYSDDERDFSGYFVDVKGHRELLVTAPTQSHMVSTLVHEFSHMIQWLEQSPVYTARTRGGIDPYAIMVDWLSGKEYKRSTVKNAIQKVRLCELDCDRRALLIIDEFNLPIDKKEYIYDAIAYQYFLLYVGVKRDWNFNGKGFSSSPIKGIVDPNLDNDFSKLPRNIKKLLDHSLS